MDRPRFVVEHLFGSWLPLEFRHELFDLMNGLPNAYFEVHLSAVGQQFVILPIDASDFSGLILRPTDVIIECTLPDQFLMAGEYPSDIPADSTRLTHFELVTVAICH